MKCNMGVGLKERIQKVHNDFVKNTLYSDVVSVTIHSVIFKEDRIHVASEIRVNSESDLGYFFDFRVDKYKVSSFMS